MIRDDDDDAIFKHIPSGVKALVILPYISQPRFNNSVVCLCLFVVVVCLVLLSYVAAAFLANKDVYKIHCRILKHIGYKNP